MAYQSLYDEALDRFKQEQAGSKHADLLKEFLKERATPEQTKEAAEALQKDSGKKYGSKKVNGVEIPETWIANIMKNIDNVIEAGDKLTEGAPESVGMAWFAIRLTLKAINSNYELYTCFGTGLSDISEIMIIITHYDRLYDERSKKNFKASPMVEKLFQDVVSVYVAVLDFSFAVKRHLTAGSLTRFKHGLKDFFGGSNKKFIEKLEVIASLKGKILEESQGAFQDKALTQLEGVSDALTGIKNSVREIQGFQEENKKLHSEQMAVLASLTSDLQDLRNSTKPKSRWDWAMHDYQRFGAALGPLKGSHKILEDLIDSIHPGTCEWTFEDEVFKRWDPVASRENLLCVTGEEGTGKSSVVASVSQRIALGDGTDRELLYVACGASPGGDSGQGGALEGGLNDPSRTADAICRTLLFELYRLAVKGGEKNVELLEACNAVFKKAAEKAQAAPLPSQDPKKLLPKFVDGITRLVSLLDKDIVLVVDDINKTSMDNKNQEELLQNLRTISKSETNRIQVLIGCSSSTLLAKDVEGSTGSICLDVTKGNRQDLEVVVGAALKEIPGLSAAEQEKAKVAIVDKAQGSFRYVFKSAIPFMSEPFQRPLSARLDALPGGLGDNYAEAIRKLSPNYIGLLRTALTRVLLAPDGRLSVREVMDAYQGTYNISEDAEKDDSAESSFPDPSRLEIQQLQDATESILRITRGDHKRGDLIVSAPDLELLSSFFVKSEEEVSEEETQEHICARCQAAHSKTASLFVDPKHAHLDIALSCLRHLNSPLFQQRAGLVPTAEDEGTKVEREPEHVGPTEEEKKEMEDRLANGLDGEESADEEDGIEHKTYDVDVDELLSMEKKSKPKLSVPARYELQEWPYHLRMAESLWSEDESQDSGTWAVLMTELDIFASGSHFSVWQAKYHEDRLHEVPGSFKIANGPHKPLHVAAYLGIEVWVQHLLDNGSDINELSHGYSPLHAAVANDQGLNMMKLLLDRGADVNAKDAVGRNALHTWLHFGLPSVEEVKMLLDHGIDATVCDDLQAMSPLHLYSARGESTEVFQILLDNGVDINTADPQYKFTPLIMLMMFREKLSPDLLRWFLDKGADPNAEDASSSRPLTIASAWGQAENLKILLDAGIDEIDDTDTDGSTALQNAVFFNRPEIVQLLLEAGADAEKLDTLNRTCLHTAVRRGNMDCTRILIEHGCNVNPKDKHGWTPFFCALLSKGEGTHQTANFILEALIAQGIPFPEINQPTRSIRTPLRQAATRGFSDIMEKLISLSTDGDDALSALAINTPDTKKRMTPLHRAARGGHLSCVQLLLSAGASPTLLDSQNKTPLIHAYEQWSISSSTEYESISSLLLNSSPAEAANDRELISVCASKASFSLLQKLYSLNADLTKPDKFGWTPLELVPTGSEAEQFLKGQETWGSKLLPSAWSTEFPGVSNMLRKSVDGETRICHTTGKKGWITADRGLPPRLGVYYFEVEVVEVLEEEKKKKKGSKTGVEMKLPPKMSIGFSTVPGTGLGNGEEGSSKVWCYYSSGKLSGSGTEEQEEGEEFWEYLRAYDVGDIVGCGVDLERKEVWVTRNGKKLDRVMKLGSEGGVKRLFPVVGLDGDEVCLETNFGRWAGGKEFLWKEESEAEGEGGKEE
ncbi:ankyrin-3 [Podospora fimiseda]|uniref:Ankyrin-3 n=1 Tax=Podospora fimiseda TaxID=252190 RepID=A0AAN6YN95_9PEZI|nr:ankyrin-3 [Podospora fimiseda]